MSVRQYIGARYVTKVYENTLDPSSAEWQASVNYEPLTMVTYNNGSYLSKKQVPASVGDPASNPTYWVQTGFYNGQIAQLQNNIQDIFEANYILLSNITGADDTEKLQNAVDTYANVLIDSDISISTVTITKPVSINLGGHKITSATSDNNTFNIRSSNVAIFNGEIETTEATPNNIRSFGSCIYVNDKDKKFPNYSNISLHDLIVSTNAVCAITMLGNNHDSKLSDIICDGSRTAVATPEGINFEWYGDIPNESGHPYNIIAENITLLDLKGTSGGFGLRTAAVFNLTFRNIYASGCGYGIGLTAGDYGGHYAPANYKEAINKNINIENVVSYNCNTAVGIVGAALGYDNQKIQAYVKNVEAYGNITNGDAINTNNTIDTIIEGVKAHDLATGIITRGDNETVCNCEIYNIQGNGISNTGFNVNMINNRLYNINQSESAGISGAAILSTSKTCSKICRNIIGDGTNEHMTMSIRNGQDYSIITENIIYSIAIDDRATGCIVDNNIVI